MTEFQDLFQNEQAQTLAGVAQGSAPMPAGADETYPAVWNDFRLYRWSVNHAQALQAAREEYTDDIVSRVGGLKRFRPPRTNEERAMGGWEWANRQIDQLRSEFPDLPRRPTDEELEQRAQFLSGQAHFQYQQMAQRERTWGGFAGYAGGTLAGAIADPVNILALPFAPEAGIGYAATAARWALIGAASQTVIEAAGAPFREKVTPGYIESGEPIKNILEAAGGAAAIGVGFKGLGALWTRLKTGTWPTSIRDAGNLLESEENIVNTNRYPGPAGTAAHRTALQDTIENMINGRPINVDRDVTPSLLAAYETRLAPVMDARSRAIAAEESAVAIEREGARLPPTMERLSEMVLGDIRGSARAIDTETAAAREALQREGTSIEAARGPLREQQAGVTAMRGEVEQLRGDVATAQQRAGTAVAGDEATRGRVAAIEQDLAQPGLSNARRAELMAERSTITETLAKTAREDERRTASLVQEQRALERQLARQERALARAEQAAMRAEQKLTERAARIAPRREALEARAANRAEAIRKEMQRTIARLAQEGYGIRLAPEDAAGLADRALGASDEQLSAGLRDITENLVSRRVEALREQPGLPGVVAPPSEVTAPGAHRARVLEGQRARAGYWTEEMRKSITALAREVGYEMPRVEAAQIAAALQHLPENQALAVLDETLLRPRTITESLPGTLEASMRAARAEAAEAARPSVIPPAMVSDLEKALEQSPEDLAKVMDSPEVNDSILRDLDRLRVERPDMEIPSGTAIDPRTGEQVTQMRRIDDVLAAADERLTAAKHIAECVGPQEGSAAP